MCSLFSPTGLLGKFLFHYCGFFLSMTSLWILLVRCGTFVTLFIHLYGSFLSSHPNRVRLLVRTSPYSPDSHRAFELLALDFDRVLGIALKMDCNRMDVLMWMCACLLRRVQVWTVFLALVPKMVLRLNIALKILTVLLKWSILTIHWL